MGVIKTISERPFLPSPVAVLLGRRRRRRWSHLSIRVYNNILAAYIYYMYITHRRSRNILLYPLYTL